MSIPIQQKHKQKRIFHMTKTKNRIGRRVLALTLAVLTIITLVFSLTACGDKKENSEQDTRENQ